MPTKTYNFPDVNRVEVIDENGRSYVKYFCNNVKNQFTRRWAYVKIVLR